MAKAAVLAGGLAAVTFAAEALQIVEHVLSAATTRNDVVDLVRARAAAHRAAIRGAPAELGGQLAPFWALVVPVTARHRQKTQRR